MIDVLNGKYQIVREIARSNDIVYEARDTGLGRRIALKELNLSTVQGQAKRERIERFNREARAAGRLTHPNIVSIYESGAENDRYFIAMEFLDGQNLRDKLQMQGALSQQDALNIAYQMLDALGYAHANKVIHRDIKPDNVQILPGGHVKLTDFGIARLTEEPALTGDGQVFGTPSYMSPEQIEGKSIDHRSDLFSMAIVLYEMLTGRKPFTGDSVITITYGIMNAEPPPMNGVPFAIENVIRRALAKNPNQRPASAEQMKADLKNAEQSPAGTPQRQPTNLGQQNTGYGLPSLMNSLPPMYPPAPYPPTPYQQPAPPYHSMPQPGYAPPTNYPPQVNSAPPPGSLPWQFNGQPPLPQNPAIPPQLAQNPNAYMANFPTPREPITISPGMRTLLYSLLAALVIGGGLAFGVVSFLKGYDQYRVAASTQKIAALMKQGKTAYDAKDFESAAKFYAQARDAKPDAPLRDQIEENLTACYIQLAQSEKAGGHWLDAKAWYDKALKLGQNALTDQARSERADALEHLGRANEARQDRSQISADDFKRAPEKATNDAQANDPLIKDADASNRREAQRLIDEGDTLYKKGDANGAREKWRQAVSKAPGTPERDEAVKRIDQTNPPPDSTPPPDASNE